MAKDKKNADHIVVVGFDGSAVKTGIEGIQRQLNSLRMPSLNMASVKQPYAMSPQVRGGGGGVRSSNATNYTANLAEKTNQLDTQLIRSRRRVQASFKMTTEQVEHFNASLAVLEGRLKRVTNRGEAKKLQEDISRLGSEIGLTNAQLREQEKQMRKNSFVSRGFADSIKNVIRGYASFFVLLEGGRSLVQAGRDMESLNALMLAGSESATAAEQNMAFVRREAKRLGVDLLAAGDGFAKISAAGMGAGMTMREIEEIFLGTAEASRAFGLNAEKQKLVFQAMTQIMSKGTVSMEELKKKVLSFWAYMTARLCKN